MEEYVLPCMHLSVHVYVYIVVCMYVCIYVCTSSIYPALPSQCQHEILYKKPLKVWPGCPFN